MKKIIFLLSFILLTGSFSFAQDNTSYKSTLSKMMEVSGSQNTYKAAIGQSIIMFKQQKSEIPAAFWDELEQSLTKSSFDHLLEMLLPVYQKHMSEQDLKELIAFYQSPVGKKLAEKTPFIVADSMQAGQVWGKKLGEDIIKKIQEKGY
ncbi:DUF2059 domain-containing protein [Pedobacter nyackensis]|uniref:DUF2059 domain-containing protein n=1 Tax=Pedobacter nyackensis TaxID=475255 RepID=A0A1W1ZYK4_9SPHI|nr:DUF2059 domain-containing protein [Pedobacter nyackensis]SMC53480.1 hypothetical protein SAMN04488101_101162 [Pedobacter nyackensis]